MCTISFNIGFSVLVLGAYVTESFPLLILLSSIMIEAPIFYLISLWKVFKKAGKKGWEAIVPFYNDWVLVKISGLNWWYFLLMISNIIQTLTSLYFTKGFYFSTGLLGKVSVILHYLPNIIATFFCSFNLAKKFHKDIGYAILLALFPFVVMPILGFPSSCQYDSSVPVSPNGPIKKGLKQVNANNQAVTSNQTDSKFCTNCGTKVSNSEKFCANCGKKLNSELKHF